MVRLVLYNCWRRRMLQLHRMLFCLRFIVIDPSFIVRDQPVLKVLWVRVIKSQKIFRDSYSFIHFIFSEHFWTQRVHTLFIPSSSWMMVNTNTNPKNLGYLFDGHSFVSHNQLKNCINVFFSDCCRWYSRSGVILKRFSPVLIFFSPFLYSGISRAELTVNIHHTLMDLFG